MLLNIVGIIMVVIASVGMVVTPHEDEIAGHLKMIELWDVIFGINSDDPGDVANTINDGGSTSESVNIEIYNLTSVNFIVSWTDSYPLGLLAGTVTVTATVSGPRGIESVSDSGTGRTGGLEFNFDLNEIYNNTDSFDTEKGKLWEDLESSYPRKDLGYGEWTISISVDRSSVRPVFGSVDYTISNDNEYFTLGSPTKISEKEKFE
jgi:hypothetical protein